MKRLILLIMLSWASLPASSEALEWLTDAQAAKEAAKQENKFVLLDFTGSDWCGWCMKLKSEVFEQPEFAGFAQANLILVEVDFPHRKQLDEAQKEANAKLARLYHITGYPSIIVLDPNGRQVGQTGYLPGGPTAFIANLERILKNNSQNSQLPTSSEPEPVRKPVTFTPIPPAVPLRYDSLALKGILGTKARRMVLINNATMLVGDTESVRVQDQRVVVCCKEIRDDSVLITADGKPMELKLGKH